MLSWLKEILGDSYTEDTEKKISQEIGKNFVAKADFNAKNDVLKKHGAFLIPERRPDSMKIDVLGTKYDMLQNKSEYDILEAQIFNGKIFMTLIRKG